MCIYSKGINFHKMTARKDISVFVVKRLAYGNIQSLYSHSSDGTYFTWKIGKIYYENLNYDKVGTSKGFYSFKNLKDAQNYAILFQSALNSIIILKAIIPKGSKYVTGVQFVNQKDVSAYCSNCLRII